MLGKEPIGCCREWRQHCTPNAQARHLWASYLGCCQGAGRRLDPLFRDVLRHWPGPREALGEGLGTWAREAQGGSVGGERGKAKGEAVP